MKTVFFRTLNFSAFNIIDNNDWKQDAILNWDECHILDQVQQKQAAYSWGFTKESPTGGYNPTRPPMTENPAGK